MTDKKTEPKLEEVKKELTVAVVMNGKYEVRRYDKDIHGKNFEKMATEFAEKNADKNDGKGYTVELREAVKGITCPNCGHIIYPEK